MLGVWNRFDEPVIMAMPKPLPTEYVTPRLEGGNVRVMVLNLDNFFFRTIGLFYGQMSHTA